MFYYFKTGSVGFIRLSKVFMIQLMKKSWVEEIKGTYEALEHFLASIKHSGLLQFFKCSQVSSSIKSYLVLRSECLVQRSALWLSWMLNEWRKEVMCGLLPGPLRCGCKEQLWSCGRLLCIQGTLDYVAGLQRAQCVCHSCVPPKMTQW